MLPGVPQRNRQPVEQDQQRIQLLLDRFTRAQEAHVQWAETAKKCVDYFEGRQWSEVDLAKMRNERRPALTINKIKPLVEIALGYFIQSQQDISYLPGHDGTGIAEVARALTHVAKQISEQTQLPFVDVEVFLDGLLTGRGFYDMRLAFERNDFGDGNISALDPFSVFPDADGEHYDASNWKAVYTLRWISIAEIAHMYGVDAMEFFGQYVGQGNQIVGPDDYHGQIWTSAPPTRFGGLEDHDSFTTIDNWHHYYDPERGDIRLIDCQYYQRVQQPFFVNLNTGQKLAVPDTWTPAKRERVVEYARAKGDPIVIQVRETKRVRWTHIIGNVMVHDNWSPYSTFTIVPYFPYFRRGQTRGFVHDLLDLQDEINKRRSARANIIGRQANSGWTVDKNAVDAPNRAKVHLMSATPGIVIEYDGKKGEAPKPIEAPNPPHAHAELQAEAVNDLKEVSGFNDSNLGLAGNEVSGVAVKRRQLQGVVGFESKVFNFKRTRELLGRKILEIIQSHYTETRLIRARGDDEKIEEIIINQRTAEGIVNNIALGSYSVVIDEAPLARSFMEGQFNQLMELKAQGVPVPDEFLVEASNLRRKEELLAALEQQRLIQQQEKMLGLPTGDHGPGPGGSKVGPDGGSLPAGEQGEPTV